MKRLIIWGCGTLGSRVGEQWDGPVIGYTHTEVRHADLRSMGIEPRLGEPLGALKADDCLLLALPSHLRQHEAVQQLQRTHQPAPQRAVFISVTGYYGIQPSTTIITEDTACGTDTRAQSIKKAEVDFQAWAGEGGVILRAGGLYRVERGPMNALIKRGYPRSGPPNKTMALIHYDDMATAVVAALTHATPEAAYVAVSPPCPTREAFYLAACNKLGLPTPHFEPPLPKPPIQYDVSRLRRDLLPQPRYPKWQAALEHDR